MSLLLGLAVTPDSRQLTLFRGSAVLFLGLILRFVSRACQSDRPYLPSPPGHRFPFVEVDK